MGRFSTNAPDREAVISATEPVRLGQENAECPRATAARAGCPYYRSSDR